MDFHRFFSPQNYNNNNNKGEDVATFPIDQLIPVIPAEASFDDPSDEMGSGFHLAPVNPVEVDFE